MTRMATRAVVVLTGTPETPDDLNQIVQRVIDAYKPDSEGYSYEFAETAPADMPVHVRDQLDTELREAGTGAVFLIVYML